VFLSSMVTTLGAGRAVHRYGTRLTLWASLALTGAGLPLRLGQIFDRIGWAACVAGSRSHSPPPL
jgi:hypothetical protein